MNKNGKARLMAGLFDSEVFVGYLKTIGDLIVYLLLNACTSISEQVSDHQCDIISVGELVRGDVVIRKCLTV